MKDLAIMAITATPEIYFNTEISGFSDVAETFPENPAIFFQLVRQTIENTLDFIYLEIQEVMFEKNDYRLDYVKKYAKAYAEDIVSIPFNLLEK